MTVSVLSYNIRYGGGGRERLIASVIRESGADVVMLQEATNPRVVQAIANHAGMEAWASNPGFSTGFVSRLPVAAHKWHFPRGGRHPFIEVELKSGLRIFGVHLSAVHSKWTERRRVRELRALLGAIAQHRQEFHLVAGDFNTLAPGERLEVRRLPPRLRALVWLSGGTIRWETVQLMFDSGYVDAYREGRRDEPGYTFPTWDPHVRLDYFFVPAPFAARIRGCDVLTACESGKTASDHFPLGATVEV